MALTKSTRAPRLSRGRLLKELNTHFAAPRIEATANKVRRLPERAGLGSLSEALGVIPKEHVKEWRQRNSAVPTLISAALIRGIRDHLRSIKGKRGARAIRLRIVDGDRFALRIVERDGHMSVTLTMRNKPFKKARA